MNTTPRARWIPLCCPTAFLWLAGALMGQETQTQYLSGHGKDDAIPWHFQCSAGPQSGYWTNLPVPSNWELHGFGSPSYQNEPTNAFAEQGLYQHDFSVPSDWAQRRVFLVFDGVMTDTHAELNGQPVGPDHQGGFYRFKYEVTRSIRFNATNHLEVRVHKRSANASINEAERRGDYWVLGGIFRPVYLQAVPAQFLERVAIDARADGTFSLDVFPNTAPSAQATLRVEAQIIDLHGQSVGPAFAQPCTSGKVTLQTRIDHPRSWSAETPELYEVKVRLLEGERVLHQLTQRFGFRTMEVREGEGLFVNGRRVVLQGANRHSFWPDSGRCLSEAVHRLDIGLMKEMNMNAVRMSHYPPDEQFLDLCDQLGLYVLDELAGWQHSYDTPTGRRLIEEMVPRDVNHPCILFWDNGNEGGWNRENDAEFARWDPQQRRVLHPWTTLNGVNTTHYLVFDRARAATEGTALFHDKTETNSHTSGKALYMPTEFLHGLYDGGVGAGLEDYWQLMSRSPYRGGGFIWALVDEGLKRSDTGQIDVAGNRAPDGILGPYRQKEASFYTVKELWSPIALQPLERAESGDFRFAVENRHSFLDARQCRFTWQSRRFRGPAERKSGFSVIAEGALSIASIPPGDRGELTVPYLKAQLAAADALALRVDDPAGQELWTWVWPLRQESGSSPWRRALDSAASQPATASETDNAISLRAGDLVVRIDKQTGLLAGAQRGAQTFSLQSGPHPAVGQATLRHIQSKPDGSDQVVTAQFDGAMPSVTWRLRANGWLECAYTYTATGTQSYHGVTFDYPESLVKKKRWLGVGPYRVWKNRLRGGTLSVWENDYNDTVTGWRDWIYPEFKGCFAGVRWLQIETTEGLITAVPAADTGFVQVLTPEFAPAELQAKTALTLPRAGLAFLEAIPPIGNKFHLARDTGPQGQPNLATGTYSNSVAFYFGPLPTAEP